MNQVRVFADVHERPSGIPRKLAAFGLLVEVLPLEVGDYLVGRIVERKRVLDLHVALRNGRPWPQLHALRRGCAFPYLLVEGTDLDRGPLYRDSARGACLAAIDLGIPVLRSAHQHESALWLRRLASLENALSFSRREKPGLST